MLVLKHVPIRSFGENIAYIHKDCSIYKIDNIKSLTRIEIHGGHQPVFAFLQIVDNNKIIRPDELGLNTEAFSQIGLPEGSKITLTLTPPAQSLSAVKRKIAGNILSNKDYEAIINDISEHRYSNSDIASFLVAVGSFVTPSEVLDL
ncbi:MAG: thymidine phosphorylase, partial [Alphaproteobacteria bacterium]|nr:thymidine phosphorylase [Alphaproteobacteria bacterium]